MSNTTFGPGDDDDSNDGRYPDKKKKLNDAQLKALSKQLTGASIFGARTNNGGTTYYFDVNTGRWGKGNNTIQDIMAPYKNYDLSDVKIGIGVTLGIINRSKSTFYIDGSPETAKDYILNKMIKEFVASGISRENISGKAYTSKSSDIGDIKTTIKLTE